MIEILVAISIILVLLAIGVVGFRSMDARTSRDGTKVAMNNAMNMMAEYEKAASLSTLGGIATGGAVTFGDISTSDPTERLRAVSNSQAAVAAFIKIPRNKDALAKLPPKSMMLPTNATVPALLDGWNNPLVFVPKGGLANVEVGGTGTSTSNTIKSPDGRPFWASAGPDGNMRMGDDNIYSFEK